MERDILQIDQNMLIMISIIGISKGGIDVSGAMIGFICWAVVGFAIVCIGIRALFSKKAVGFWANTKTIQAKDIQGYNRATGKLFICYGIIFVILGIPLLSGQNSPLILLSVLGVMIETIAIMAVYSIVVAKKYGVQSN